MVVTRAGRSARSGNGSACTLYDVAREAGVSTATVSRVVQGQNRVRVSTRQRVLDVIEALGYVPDSAAQSMARHRKDVIGLVALENPCPDTDIEYDALLFFEGVLRGVESVLNRVGWSLLITFLRDLDEDAALQRMMRISGQVDGLLIAEGILSSPRLALLAARVPIAVIAGFLGEAHADVIAVDNQAGTEALVSHLIEQHGRNRLYYIAGPPDAPDARERQRAFDDAIARYPGAVPVGSFPGRFATISGQQAVRELLARPRREMPDAIVCANDQMAIGAMRELQNAAISIPRDVAVTGFDGIPIGAMLTPALTTVRQPVRQLGERASARLIDKIADPTLPRLAERLPTELVIRESCGCSQATMHRSPSSSHPTDA
jgi:LacI family transcriptional regulator